MDTPVDPCTTYVGCAKDNITIPLPTETPVEQVTETVKEAATLALTGQDIFWIAILVGAALVLAGVILFKRRK